MLDKPELKDKPVAVGGDFSVVCTANYVARKYGVRSALPTFIAKKLCPELILIQPDFTKYKKYSNIFRDILRKFDR
jgi:DNA polymerase kappa